MKYTVLLVAIVVLVLVASYALDHFQKRDK